MTSDLNVKCIKIIISFQLLNICIYSTCNSTNLHFPKIRISLLYFFTNILYAFFEDVVMNGKRVALPDCLFRMSHGSTIVSTRRDIHLKQHNTLVSNTPPRYHRRFYMAYAGHLRANKGLPLAARVERNDQLL